MLAAVGAPTGPRLNWAPVWAAVAAGAIIAAVVFNTRVHRASAELAQAAAELEHMQAQSAAQTRELTRLNTAFAILNQPNVRQVIFGGGAPQPPRGRIFLDAARGVVLLASNLPPVPAGKTYEMWVIPKGKGGKPVPAGLFQSTAGRDCRARAPRCLGCGRHSRPGGDRRTSRGRRDAQFAACLRGRPVIPGPIRPLSVK